MTEENKLKEAAEKEFPTMGVMSRITRTVNNSRQQIFINAIKSKAAKEYWQKEQSRVDVEGLRKDFDRWLKEQPLSEYLSDQQFDKIIEWFMTNLPLSSKQEESKEAVEGLFQQVFDIWYDTSITHSQAEEKIKALLTPYLSSNQTVEPTWHEIKEDIDSYMKVFKYMKYTDSEAANYITTELRLKYSFLRKPAPPSKGN